LEAEAENVFLREVAVQANQPEKAVEVQRARAGLIHQRHHLRRSWSAASCITIIHHHHRDHHA
jgi:hypothetical protein